MWTTVLVALALAHAGHGFTLHGFRVPPAPEYGSTVTLEASYRLGRGEYIKKMKWYKDNDIFMSYSERPHEFFEWTPITGVNIDQAASSPSMVVITDVGDAASGQYTLEVQVYGPGGNVANIVNSQGMSVGGADTIGTRFGGGGSGLGGGVGGGTFFQSSNVGGGFPGTSFQSSFTGGGFPGTSFQSSSTGGAFPGNSFQSSSAGGNTAFQSSGAGGSFQSATAGFPGAGSQSFQGVAAGGGAGPLGVRNSFQSSSSGGNTAFQSSGAGGSFQSATAGSPGAGSQSFQGVVAGGAGPLGVRNSFQSSSTGGEIGGQSAVAIQSAVAQAQAQVQNAVNQINQLQAALAGIGF